MSLAWTSGSDCLFTQWFAGLLRDFSCERREAAACLLRPYMWCLASHGYVLCFGSLESLADTFGSEDGAQPVIHSATPLISPKSSIMFTLHMAQLFNRLRRAYGGQEIDGSPARRARLIWSDRLKKYVRE
jgi:hypothetical protein